MLLEKLAASLNRNVAAVARRRGRWSRSSHGRSLSLTLEGTPLAFAMRVDGGPDPLSDERVDADAHALGYAARARWRSSAPSAEGALRAVTVRISGDAEIAQTFRDLLRQAQPDVEEELARLVGDVAAHQIGSFARGLAGWGRKAADTFATSVAEYLQEEGRDVPTRIELDEFLHDVDRLRDDVERLEARLAPARGRAARLTRDCRRCVCARSAACCRSSACWCGTGSTRSSSRPTCSGRCASCSTSRRRPGSNAARAARAASGIRLALEELGPIFVKFGQALSTRRDLLPADIADELAKLQDRVPPFPGAEARAIVERAYGRPVAEVFETFDENPLAAASIAQVHTARLRGGQEVVVKVAASGRARGDRARPRGHVRARAFRARLFQRRPSAAAARSRARVREDDPRRARPDARSRATPRSSAQFRGLARCSTCPRCTGTTAAPT